MGVGELLDRIREQYIEQFSAAAARLAQRDGMHVLSEVVLRDASGAVVGEGALGLPVRLDLVVVASGRASESISVDSEQLLQFSPIQFAWSDQLTVTVGPFQWDAVTIRLQAVSGGVDNPQLAHWFRKWFREEEDGSGDLLGVVHFLSDAEVVGREIRFSADLGSAPVKAFEGLLDAAAAARATEVLIGRVA